MNTRQTLAAILTAAALALTACTTTPDTSSDNPATTTITETTPTPDDMTALVVDISWEQQTEADRDTMCDGLALFGTAWGAEQMQLGAGGDTAVDWDRAAVLVEQKCAQR